MIHTSRAGRQRAIPHASSPIAESFALQIRAEKLPRPIREFQFAPPRKWRLDFAWPDMHLAVEIDGEVHRIKDRFHADLEKHAQLALRGWTLLRVGGREVRSTQGLQWLQSLIWERVPLGLSRAHETSDGRGPTAVPRRIGPSGGRFVALQHELTDCTLCVKDGACQ